MSARERLRKALVGLVLLVIAAPFVIVAILAVGAMLHPTTRRPL